MSISLSYINQNHLHPFLSRRNTSTTKKMAINKLTITLFLLISLAVFHCLAFRVEVQEFEPPQQEGQEGHGGGSGEGWDEEATKNPYHFGRWSFKNFFQSQEGFVKMLPKFTKRSSTLFRGIENYRFLFQEMQPNTFLVPHHLDADYVFLVVQGYIHSFQSCSTLLVVLKKLNLIKKSY